MSGGMTVKMSIRVLRTGTQDSIVLALVSINKFKKKYYLKKLFFREILPVITWNVLL